MLLRRTLLHTHYPYKMAMATTMSPHVYSCTYRKSVL